jgi:hypothetical protein
MLECSYICKTTKITTTILDGDYSAKQFNAFWESFYSLNSGRTIIYDIIISLD